MADMQEMMMPRVSTQSSTCRLKYDEGEDEESIEWVDFRELTVEEIKQHPSCPVVQRPPVPPRPTPPVAPRPAPGPHDAPRSGRNAAVSAEQVGFKVRNCGFVHSAAQRRVDVVTICKHVVTPFSGFQQYFE